jgi:hypothetical protein
MAENVADADGFAGLGAVCGDAEDAAVDRLDFLDCFVAFDAEERFAGVDEVAVLFQPCDKGAFFHRPAQTRNDNFDGHELIPQ